MDLLGGFWRLTLSSDNTVLGVNSHGVQYMITVETIPVGEGVSRVAFKAIIYEPEDKKGEEAVIKRFKSDYDRKLSKEGSQIDIKASKTARKLAVQFSQLQEIPVTVKFLLPLLIKVTSINTTIYQLFGGVVPLREQETVFLEPYLAGNYRKWISNTGKVITLQEVLLTFCHWTWVETNGKLLVCDLQGVEDRRGNFNLTDPAINSTAQEYGGTDLGKLGIYMFFYQHTCTRLCRRLGLRDKVPRIPEQLRTAINHIQSPTTYAALIPNLFNVNMTLPAPVVPVPVHQPVRAPEQRVPMQELVQEPVHIVREPRWVPARVLAPPVQEIRVRPPETQDKEKCCCCCLIL